VAVCDDLSAGVININRNAALSAAVAAAAAAVTPASNYSASQKFTHTCSSIIAFVFC